MDTGYSSAPVDWIPDPRRHRTRRRHANCKQNNCFLSSSYESLTDSLFKQPIIAVQAALKPADVAIGMSVLVFIQNMGIAILLAVADTIFNTTLQHEVEKVAPSAGVSTIIRAGATHFRALVTPEELPSMLMAYSNSVTRVFYLVVAISSIAVFTSLFMGWTDIRKKNKGPKKQALAATEQDAALEKV